METPVFLSDKTDGDSLCAAEINTLSTADKTLWANMQTLDDSIATYRGRENRITISNATGDADHDITFAAGWMYDSTGIYGINLTTAITKRIDATWAAGTDAGGRASASLSASTWYHCFLLYNPTTGDIDAGFDTSITAANLLSATYAGNAGYTKYRRVGTIYVSSGSTIVGFTQVDTYFWVKTNGSGYVVAVTTSSQYQYTLWMPPQYCIGIFTFSVNNGAATDIGTEWATLAATDAYAFDLYNEDSTLVYMPMEGGTLSVRSGDSSYYIHGLIKGWVDVTL